MKIVINGHKDSLNNGNMLMALGFFEGLRKKNICASITLLSDLPEIDSERYKDQPAVKVIDRPWSKQRKGAIGAIAIAIFYALWVLIGRSVELISGYRVKIPWDSLSQAYDESNFVIDISGDDLTTAYGWKAPLQVLYELLLAKIFGSKTVLLAQSMGPFDSLFMKFVASLLQNLADIVTLRDTRSFLMWQQILNPNNRQKFKVEKPLADLAHLNNMPMANSASDRGPVVINLSNYVVGSTLNPKNEVDDPLKLDYHMSNWEKILERIYLFTDRELLFLPHTFRPGKGDDEYWLNLLYKRCSAELPIRLINGPLAPFEIQKIVANSSFIIASRMHLAITAMNCCVPFLSLAYSHKYQQLIPPAFFDIPPVIYANQFDEDRLFFTVEKRFKLLWNDRQAYQSAIEKHALKARSLAEENINLISIQSD